MSYADIMFLSACEEIIKHGFSDEGFDVRPRWSDGTPAHTKKVLYVHHKYDLINDPIPAITVRKQYFKGCLDEILWIYQRQSNKLSELNSNVWDSWNVGDGTIGKAYGYQIAKLSKHHKYKSTDYKELDSGFYGNFRVDPVDNYVYLNQMGAVLWDLKHDPSSRRIMTNTYNHEELTEMGLAPCAYSIHFNVTKNPWFKKPVLNAILYQRSQDMLAANGWNVMQYSALVQMVAQVVDMVPGLFHHMIADCHIYDRHIPIINELRESFNTAMMGEDKKGCREPNLENVPFKNPGFEINKDVKSFFDFTVNDLKLVNYQALEFNHKIGNGPGCDIEVCV